VTKWAKQVAKRRERENVVITRKIYRGKRWLKEFAIGIRLIELAWIEQMRYRRYVK